MAARIDVNIQYSQIVHSADRKEKYKKNKMSLVWEHGMRTGTWREGWMGSKAGGTSSGYTMRDFETHVRAIPDHLELVLSCI